MFLTDNVPKIDVKVHFVQVPSFIPFNKNF